MCTPGLYVPSRHMPFVKDAQMPASSYLNLLQGLPAISTHQKVYPNGALPRQTNNVNLYHMAQMNLPIISPTAYNSQSTFTLTGGGKLTNSSE